MKHTATSSLSFVSVVLLVAVLSVCALSFAQAAESTGSVKDVSINRGNKSVIIDTNQVRSSYLSGPDTSETPATTSDSLMSLGKYTLLTSNRAVPVSPAPDLLKLSDLSLDRNVNSPPEGETWVKEKPEASASATFWEKGVGKSYFIPALEIPAFLLLLNGYDRLVYPNVTEDGKKVYETNPSSFWNHVVYGPWGVDQDSFAMNQFAHPYQGSVYHGFARSAGLNYWQSLIYTNAGSFLWETAGETTHPSINDQIASGVGGSFFGEVLFRMAGLVLDSGGDKPGFWRELGAAVISPPTGINRLAFGDRFKPVFPSHSPATFERLRLGVSLNSQLGEKGRTEATADFSIAYGLPGKPDYSYTRPFDYFHLELASLGNANNPIENVMIRGLLLGKEYEAGDSYRGIWGLYGGYDYISPHIFRVSSTSASLGTTFQWWLSHAVSLQGSVLGGVGYAAAGNVTQVGERDYHYGVAPQGLVGLRLILGDKAMFDVTGRTYFLTGVGGGDPGGNETINRLNMNFTVRIYDHHALGLQYIASVRDAHYPDRADSHQTGGTISLVYTFLSDTGFGAVEWRANEKQ